MAARAAGLLGSAPQLMADGERKYDDFEKRLASLRYADALATEIANSVRIDSLTSCGLRFLFRREAQRCGTILFRPAFC